MPPCLSFGSEVAREESGFSDVRVNMIGKASSGVVKGRSFLKRNGSYSYFGMKMETYLSHRERQSEIFNKADLRVQVLDFHSIFGPPPAEMFIVDSLQYQNDCRHCVQLIDSRYTTKTDTLCQ